MAIAVFGSKSFAVSSNKVYTFDDFALSGSLETEAQDVAGKKPSTYIKGPGLDTISFKIVLDATRGINVGKEVGDWKSMCAAAVPQPFTIGGYPLTANKWLVKSVSVSNVTFDNKGRWRKATLELSFEEYVRAGSAAAKSKGAKKKTKEKKGLAFYQDKYKKGQPNQKRNNPNATAAVQNGPAGGR